jgi:hypothetical protein
MGDLDAPYILELPIYNYLVMGVNHVTGRFTRHHQSLSRCLRAPTGIDGLAGAKWISPSDETTGLRNIQSRVGKFSAAWMQRLGIAFREFARPTGSADKV